MPPFATTVASSQSAGTSTTILNEVAPAGAGKGLVTIDENKEMAPSPLSETRSSSVVPEPSPSMSRSSSSSNKRMKTSSSMNLAGQMKRGSSQSSRTSKMDGTDPGSGEQTAADRKGSRKKKVKEAEVAFDESDIDGPLPNGLKVYCLHPSTQKYHLAKILERKGHVPGQASSSANSTRSIFDMGGTANLPEEIATIVEHHSKTHVYVYYVHYLEWDRRMDEWTQRDRIITLKYSSLIQSKSSYAQSQPKPALPKSSSQPMLTDYDEASANMQDSKSNEEDINKANQSSSASPSSSPVPVSSLIASIDGHAESHGSMGGHGNFSEDDIKAHEEATKVKNIDAIQLGPYKITTSVNLIRTFHYHK